MGRLFWVDLLTWFVCRRRLIVLEGLPAAAGHGQFGRGQLSDLRPEELTDLLVGLLRPMGP